MKHMMTQSSFFFSVFETFLALKTTLCHYHKFSFFFLSFKIRKPDGDQVLHAMGGVLEEEQSNAAAEGQQPERRGRSGLRRKHRGAVRRVPSGAPPRQRRGS